MRTLLAPAHLTLTVIILVWNIVLAGRIAQNSQSPRLFQAISGLAALLILPGLLLVLATSTVITGRAVVTMDWVWPAVLLLFVAQSGYALFKRWVSPWWGIPIFTYNLVILCVGIARFLAAHGIAPTTAGVVLLAAQSTAMVFAGGTANVLASPFYVNMPLVSPAFPALRKRTVVFRAFMMAYAFLWVLFIFGIGMPRAVVQLRNYEAHRRDQLRERPNADFAVGLKILPDIGSPPAPPAIRSDWAMIDTLDLDALAVVIAPNASRQAIDSVARIVDPTRRGAKQLIVAIGYSGKLIPELGTVPLDTRARLETMARVVQRMHPDIVLPAEDPYTAGDRALGTLPVDAWTAYLSQAARVAKTMDPRVKVGVSASAYTRADSALYVWAASPQSPIDIVGFSFFPSPYVGGGIQADTRTADRWMRAHPPRKPHYVFATGGYPLAYGEASQYDSIWEVMAWATDHPAIKGLVVYEAGDYGQARGLRAPNGRLRPATMGVMRAIEGLRESAK